MRGQLRTLQRTLLASEQTAAAQAEEILRLRSEVGPTDAKAETETAPARDGATDDAYLSAIRCTVAYLRSVCAECVHFDASAEKAFALPRLMSSTGNKSFQSLLEHDSMRALAGLRRRRAADVMQLDTQGWSSVRANLVAVDGAASVVAADPIAAVESEDEVAQLLVAVSELSGLVLSSRVRAAAAELGAPDPSLAQVTDVEGFVRRLQTGSQKHLQRACELERRREEVQRNYRNLSREKLQLEHRARLLASINADALQTASSEIAARLQADRRRLAPLGVDKPRVHTHKHLVDFASPGEREDRTLPSAFPDHRPPLRFDDC